MTNLLQSKAMLAQLSISQWTATRQDKKATSEVETNHGAHDAGRFNKRLVSKELLEPISKIAAEARGAHYHYTLAWSDSGPRLLPSEFFADFTSRFRVLRTNFDAAVSDMLQKYPAEVQAARNRLGTLYEPDDYPDPHDMKGKFAMNLEFTPVPDGDDFRVSVGEADKEELAASVRSAVAARQAAAVAATYSRIREVVGKIEERLCIPDAIFKDSLINNAIELSMILDGLNITDDPQITSINEDIKQNLLMPPSVLRTSSDVRAKVAQHASRILGRLP